MRAIIAIAILVGANVNGATPPPGYDKLGPLASPPLKNDDLLVRVRTFITGHWKKHRRGYVMYTVRSRHEEPITGTGSIEPTTDGIWHIRFKSHNADSGRPIHSFDAVSFRYYGPYLYFHDESDKLVGAL